MTELATYMYQIKYCICLIVVFYISTTNLYIVFPVDTTPPQCVNLPNEISRTVELGTPGVEISWIEPTCSDISGTASISTRSHTPPSFFAVGMAVVSYTCTDMSGNSETCTFPVTVTTGRIT